jgi:hypothetical protein
MEETMRSRRLFSLAMTAAVGLWASTLAKADQPIIDVVGNIFPTNEYSANWSPSTTYKDWGNEPFVAVNPLNTNQIITEGFGYSSPTGSLFYSTDGGATWGARFPITTPFAGVTVPNDQVYQYDSAGTLHGILLGSSGSNVNIYHGSTVNPNNDGFFGRPATTWIWTQNAPTNNALNSASLNKADQPWIARSGNTIFAAYDNFNGGVEERVAISTDNGVSFPNDIPVSANGQQPTTTNPGLRMAADGAGHIYAVWGLGTGNVGGVENVTWHFNRYTSGNAWDFTNNSGGSGGIVVDSGNSAQIGSSFGGINELRGNTTAIAATSDGLHVYIVYGKRDASNVDRLWLTEFHPSGNTMVQRANPVAFSLAANEWAVLPSVAVTANGTVVIEYDTFTPGTTGPGTFHIHLASSTDGGLTFSDSILYNFTTPGAPNTPAFPDATRMLGDYQFLMSMNNTVYGTYAARGNVNQINGGVTYNTTPNIDPFFFSQTFTGQQNPTPEPGTVGLLIGLGISGCTLAARRRRRSR